MAKTISNNNMLMVRVMVQGIYSLNGKTSYRQISRNPEAARLDVIMIEISR